MKLFYFLSLFIFCSWIMQLKVEKDYRIIAGKQISEKCLPKKFYNIQKNIYTVYILI